MGWRPSSHRIHRDLTSTSAPHHDRTSEARIQPNEGKWFKDSDGDLPQWHGRKGLLECLSPRDPCREFQPPQLLQHHLPHRVPESMYWFFGGQIVNPGDTRGPLTPRSLAENLLFPFLCHYATAILVLLPHTRVLRFALLPITLWSIFRGITTIDLSFGDETLAIVNYFFTMFFTMGATRTIIWATQSTPFSRAQSPGGVPPSRPTQLAIDAFDLCVNLRGLGWSWSTDLRVPLETRPTSSVYAFAKTTFVSFIQHALMFDISHYGIQSFAPSTIGSPRGGTIFDPSLPPSQRYLYSTTMTALGTITIYSGLQALYDICTLLGVLVFSQHPSQWPPMFDSPWSSSSLIELWGKRWHQLYRNISFPLGGHPLSLVFGQPGAVVGTFLVTGIVHDAALWGTGRGTDPRYVTGFFLVSAVGILLELCWRKCTGSRVGGSVGRVWTTAWVLSTSHLSLIAFTQKGILGTRAFPTGLRPAEIIFGALPNGPPRG